MPNKKLSSFTDEITTLNSTDRFLVARAGSSLDHFVTAQNLVPGYKGTSTTSRAIASSGSITVSTQSGLAYVVGSRVRLASSASPANYMEGVVTSYSSTTLVFTSDVAGGSGTFASWNLSLAGDRGAAGATGATGAAGAGYGGTSTTSRTIASSGSISVTTQAGLAYVVGSRVRLASSASPSNYMEGVITSYSSTTLVFTSDLAGGSGTIASWTLSLAGDRGATGTTGANGIDGFGLFLTYNSGTTAGAGAGQIRLNSATIASVTSLFVSETDANSVNISSILGEIQNGSILFFRSRDTANEYAFFQVSGAITDNGSDRTIPVTYLSHTGTFADPENLLLTPSIRGVPGVDGVSAFGLRYTFSTTTTSGPSSGQLRLNNASYASATSIFVHETSNAGNVAALLGAIADGSPLLVLDDNDSTAYAYFTMDSQIDNGSDRTLSVTHIASAGTFSGNVSLTFAARGSTGATGSVSSASGLTLTQVATPSAPSAGNTVLYAKADGGIYGLGATGSEFRLDDQTFSNQHTATSLAAGSNSNFDLNLGRTGVFTTIQSDKQAWLTVYISEAARTADASRIITADPATGSGVLADVIFTGASTISLTPTVNYWATANVFFRLRNTDVSTQTIIATINGVRFN